MPGIDGGEDRDLEVVEEAIVWLRQRRWWGRPDKAYAGKIDNILREVRGLRKSVATATAEKKVAADALDKISRVALDNPALHGAELGRAKEIAFEAHRKINP